MVSYEREDTAPVLLLTALFQAGGSETDHPLLPAPDIVQLQPERLRSETAENKFEGASPSKSAIRMKHRDAWIEIPDGMEPATIASVQQALSRL